MRHLVAVNTHQEAVSVCDKALRNNLLPSVALRLVLLNQSTVGCPTSSAQGPEPKCYEPPKTRKQHVRQTNQNRILKTLLLKPCCKKTRRCQLPYNKNWLLSRTPEWGQEIGTKTGRAARGLPSTQECDVGCSNQRDGQAKGRHARRAANHADEAPATCWQRTFLESAPAQKTPPQVGSKIGTPKWGPS